MSRTQGAILLARQSVSQDEIAEKVGVSRVSVSKWLNGHVKPTAKKREEIATAYEIPAASWDEESERPSSPSSVVPGAATQAPLADPEAVVSSVVSLDAMVRQLMSKVRQDAGAPPLEQAKVMRACAASLRELADIKRVWDRYERAILRALAPFPDAARALRIELRKADSD